MCCARNDPLPWLTPETEDVWRRHARRVQEVYDGGRPDPPVAVFGLMAGRSHGLWGTNDPDMLLEPEAWLEDVLRDMAQHAGLAMDDRIFRPFVVELDAFGTHYVDALFGARVTYHEGQAWSEQLAVDPDDLEEPDIEENTVFRQSRQLAQMAVERTGGRVWIANPVLSCPVNIGMNLFGGRMLECMAERPGKAHHALGIIADVIEHGMRAFAAIIPPLQRQNSVGATRWAPPGHGFLDGCAAQLVSARHYREFLAPLDARLLSSYPRPGMIHLCGAHAHHIPAWREMPQLKSVQLNDRATDDLELYWRGLREDQVLYVTPNAQWPPERILSLTGGRRIILQTDCIP